MSELMSENLIETSGERFAHSGLIVAMTIGGLLALAAAIGLVLVKPRQATNSGLIAPASAAMILSGEALYLRQCASCHGTRRDGQLLFSSKEASAPSLDETGHAVNHSDFQLFLRVANGARTVDGRISMPAFRGILADYEIVAVLSYIASGWPDAILRRRGEADWTFPADCGPSAGANKKAGDRT